MPNVQGEWIHPDAASAATVLQIGVNCPSGAIRVTRNDGAASSDAAPMVNLLRIRENGPLAFEAPLLVRGIAEPTPRATLCRCGASANKPYCDGSHTAAGFTATGEPAIKEFVELEARNGPVEVSPQPNGPLKVVGNLEVISGTGAHHQPGDPNLPVPLRPLAEQTLLRRKSQGGRVRGGIAG